CLILLWSGSFGSIGWSQQVATGNAGGNQVAGRAAGGFHITESVDTIELTVGSSRRLTFDYKVPEVIVEHPNLINATPISANQVNVTGKQPGVSTITFRDMEGKSQSVTVLVKLDVRKVEMAISQHFPNSAVKVTALSTGVVLAGYVSRAQDVDSIVAVARDYFPTNVINLLQVEGAQVVAIEVKVYEVSRTKLKNMGIDWAVLGQRFDIVSGFSDLIQNVTTPAAVSGDANMAIGVINDNGSFNLVVNALEQNNIAKLLSQPTLVTSNGRPAEFLSGGEIPIQVPSGLGTVSIEFRPFGTKLDFVPLVHGEGNLTLEVRAEVSEVAPELSGATGVPGFRVRRVNTGVPMRAGQTVALAGDIFEKSDSDVGGAPGLVDVPFWGAPFRNTRDSRTETELVFLITPRFINSVDPTVTPLTPPGLRSTNPSNLELFSNGYIEVPACGEDCPRELGAPFGMQRPEQAVPAGSVSQNLPYGSYQGQAYS
ncbi:MAG: type II and III secretion system protein family protein, partial [Planctomycetota bacterium]